jgi:hypothetical protein
VPGSQPLRKLSVAYYERVVLRLDLTYLRFNIYLTRAAAHAEPIEQSDSTIGAPYAYYVRDTLCQRVLQLV